MKNELDIIGDLSQRLSSVQVPFMLTGSLAMSFYAIPRMTRDIDIVVDLKVEDAPRLVAAVEGDYYVALESVLSSIRLQRPFNIIHFESVIKVDCIVRKNTEFALVEFSRRQPIAFGGRRTMIVSKEDLILAKLAWARHSRSEKQLADVRNLLARDYDKEYLESWADRLDLRDLLEDCRHE